MENGLLYSFEFDPRTVPIHCFREGIDSIHRQLSFLSTLWRLRLWDRFTVSKLLLIPSIHAWHTKRGRQEKISFLPASKPKPSFVGLMCDCLLMDLLAYPFLFGVSSHIRSDYSCWGRLCPWFCSNSDKVLKVADSLYVLKIKTESRSQIDLALRKERS